MVGENTGDENAVEEAFNHRSKPAIRQCFQQARPPLAWTGLYQHRKDLSEKLNIVSFQCRSGAYEIHCNGAMARWGRARVFYA